MKKYILSLIVILLLTFTLIGNCAWLAGWDYRIELEIADYANDIGASVTWMPVDIFLTATQAEEIFTELTTDAEYLKVAITKSDGTTELYGHNLLFDVSETLGIYRVSRDGWTINANTSVFIYYDKDHADNTTYIGKINTTPCENVYDGNFDAVYTMEDGADTSSVYDATSNNNDIAKFAANEPNEVTGKVGQAQDFDGSDDLITKTSAAFMEDPGTIEILFNADTINTNGVNLGYRMTVIQYGDTYAAIQFDSTDNKIQHFFYDGTLKAWKGDTAITADGSTWYYLAVVEQTSGNGSEMFLNGVADGDHATYTWQDNTGGNNLELDIGGDIAGDHTVDSFNGKVDEVRTSSINCQRSAAWIKGTYNSWWDALFTYGIEEEAPVGITLNGITITKWNGITITIPINTQ